MSLAILTPFEGKAWALSEWTRGLGRIRLPEGTRFIWFCNAESNDFWTRLQVEAVALPYAVSLWCDATKIIGTPHAKDRTVSRLWRELRRRVPADTDRILCLEDDVLMGDDTVGRLLTLSKCYGEANVIGAPVPCRIPGSDGVYGAWFHRGGRFVDAPAQPIPAPVDSISFGCTLFPRSLFDGLTLASANDALSDQAWGYDRCAGEEVRAMGAQMIAAWGVPVEHLQHPEGDA